MNVSFMRRPQRTISGFAFTSRASSSTISTRTQALYIEVPLLTPRRASDGPEAAIALLLVETGRLEGVCIEVDQAATALSRVALGCANEPAAQSRCARPLREPKQLDVAFAPVGLQDQTAEQSPLAVAHADDRARVLERTRAAPVERHQPLPKRARNRRPRRTLHGHSHVELR